MFSKLKLSKFYKATSNTMFSDMIITKESFLILIKAAMQRKYVKELKRIQEEMHIEVDNDVEKTLIKYDIQNKSDNNNDSIAKYYTNKDNVNLSLTNETQFMSHYFWLRVHQLLTSSLKNNDSKYRIFQVKENDSLSKQPALNNKLSLIHI